MFIDILTVVMINVVAGLFILAWFLWKGLDAEDRKPWAAKFENKSAFREIPDYNGMVYFIVAGTHLPKETG